MDLFVDLDPDRPEPLYKQLQLSLTDLIVTGQLPDGTRLPSSRSLSQQLKISRNTVNLCYQEIIAAGLATAAERQGIFVSHAAGGRRPRVDGGAHRGRANTGASADGSDRAGRIDWAGRILPQGDEGMPEISKDAAWLDAPYPFVAGQVEANRFPARAWQRCLRETMFKPHLGYSVLDDFNGDDPQLVKCVQERILPGRGVYAEESEIMITLGSQQGLAMLGQLLIGPGGRVLMENPGYLDARHIFARSDADLLPMPVDEDGAVVPESTAGVDVLYTTPSHHHPTNVTMSVARRKQLLETTVASGTIVIEDDYDSEFRYHGRPSPSLKALDRSGNVVYLGTFSKFLSPGLRLGYLVGPAELIAAAKKERRYTVRHAPGQLQRAMALFIDSGDYHRTLRLARNQMTRKFDTAASTAHAHFPLALPAFPPGGVSLWVDAGDTFDLGELIAAAHRRGIVVERGDIFYMEGTDRAVFRLGFGAIPLRRIQPGIELLGETMRGLL